MPLSEPAIDASMAERGWYLLPEAVDAGLLERLRVEMEAAYEKCRAIQEKNGVAGDADGTMHHLLCHRGSFLELLGQLHFDGEMRRFLEGNYILNSFGGVINRRNAPSYVTRVHRDIRTFTGELKQMVNMLVMVDDFTPENGATRLLSGSHMHEEKPDDAEFEASAEKITGKAGSILLFDSNVWHAAGRNQTEAPRRALTLTFTRPFLKPQFDYPRFFGYEAKDSFSGPLRQLLGYNARVPSSLDEWYQPPELRMYQPGQG